MQLLKWQEAVQESILSTQDERRAAVLSWIKQGTALPPESIDVEARLGVYVDAYVLRLGEALRANYPAVHQLLGDDDFDALVRRYLKAHPPAHASIRWFGEHLAVFLAQEEPYSVVPAIAELAAFEWALRHTIDAADAAVLAPEYLYSLNPQSWGELTFRVHPSLTILTLSWNAPQIWRALTAAKAPPAPVQQADFWLVYRQPDLVTGWRSASALEVTALENIARGQSFSDLCEDLCNLTEDVDAVPLTAATFLRDWVSQGLLSLRVEKTKEHIQ